MEQLNERYSRHLSLKGFGPEGQKLLSAAKVLVVGAGGLGCPVLQYLTAAGIGEIGIADADIVSLSNLQRQVLYTTEDIGKPKTKVATLRLKQLNPNVVFKTFDFNVTSENALNIFRTYDIIVDCTDNFASRYLLNDACFLLQKPLVFGAIYQYEGQIAVFHVNKGNNNLTNYRDLFAEPPKPDEVPDCNEAGVLGVLPGIIGVMQASEVVKIISGVGEIILNKVLNYNLLSNETFIIDIDHNPETEMLIPQSEALFENTDYNWLCGYKKFTPMLLDTESFKTAILDFDTVVIDVREPEELPSPNFENLNIPLSNLLKNIPEIRESNIIVFCQSGKRSSKAAEILFEKFGNSKKISHLENGIQSLKL